MMRRCRHTHTDVSSDTRMLPTQQPSHILLGVFFVCFSVSRGSLPSCCRCRWQWRHYRSTSSLTFTHSLFHQRIHFGIKWLFASTHLVCRPEATSVLLFTKKKQNKMTHSQTLRTTRTLGACLFSPLCATSRRLNSRYSTVFMFPLGWPPRPRRKVVDF